MNKLTEEQILDRITVYQEAIEHLDMSIYHSTSEETQGQIVKKQIQRLLDKFLKNHQ